MVWSPDHYLKFADHRLRPALDLLARIDLDQPRVIVDLGCGAGNVTAWLRKRWPDSAISGIDSSAEMLERARQALPQAAWIHADIGGWRPAAPPDLIFSNAALHWLDNHQTLLPALLASLAQGGVLAVQMPRNADQPSHRLLHQAARTGPWSARLAPLLRPAPVAEPADYWRWLAPTGARLEIWETTYLQRLTGDDAVLHWLLGTTLRPLLAVLDPPESVDFLSGLAAMLREAYPPEPDGGTLFPFKRLFLLASRREGGHNAV